MSGDNISKESEECSDSELSGSELDVSSDQDTIIDVFTESSDDDMDEYRPQMGWTTVLSDKNIAHFNLTGGPKLPRNIDMNSSPLEYFYLMLSESIYTAYMGLSILMSINPMPEYNDYWSTEIFIGNRGFQDTMTLNRYQKLTQYLHCNVTAARVGRNDPGYHPIVKVSPVVEMANSNFVKYYQHN